LRCFEKAEMPLFCYIVTNRSIRWSFNLQVYSNV